MENDRGKDYFGYIGIDEKMTLKCIIEKYNAAIEAEVRGFKPDRGRQIFKGDKNPQHSSLWRGKKPSVPCREILRHVNGTFQI
jgi:hypothetical protein